MPEDFDFSQYDDLGSSLTPAEKRKLRRLDAPKKVENVTVEQWNEMPSDERRQMATDALAKMAQKWDGDSQDEAAYRSMIAAANMLLNVILSVNPSDCSEPVVTCMTHAYTSLMGEIQRLDAMRAFYPHVFKID